MELQGTSAIVTGGASGLGAAAVRALAKEGAKVVLVDLQDDRGRAVADDVDGEYLRGDVADEDAFAAVVDTAEHLGPLRALVNAAGIGSAARTVGRDGTPADLAGFERVIRVNLIGTFNCIRLAAAAMGRTAPQADGERGAIVNTASVAAFDGQIGQAAYSASKGGVVGLTLPIARDLAALGIRINTIAPGLFDTPIYGEGPRAEAFKSKLGESVVFPKRLGHPEEFASMVVELLRNPYMNGEVVRLDGAIRMPPR